MMPEFQPLLSPTGERRRERILGLALAEARGRRRRRVLVRASLTLAAVCVAVLALQFLRSPPPSHPGVAVKPPQPHPQVPAKSPVVVTLIETDPDIIERLAIRPQPSHVVVISDNELLNELAMAHRPAGLAYVNGKATLLFR